MEELMKRCLFNGKKCSDDSVYMAQPPNMGPCLVFPGGALMKDTQRGSGLKVILKVDIDDRIRLGSIDNKAGMIVAITAPRSLSTIE